MIRKIRKIRKIIVIIAFVLAFPSAVSAQILDGTQPILVFHDTNPEPEIVYTKPENLKPSDRWFPFVAINGNMIAQEYSLNVNGSGYFVKSREAIPPSPNVDSFIQDLASDSAIPTALVDRVTSTLLRLVNYPPALKAYWARLTANPPAGLSAALITKIEDYASARSMPLK